MVVTTGYTGTGDQAGLSSAQYNAMVAANAAAGGSPNYVPVAPSGPNTTLLPGGIPVSTSAAQNGYIGSPFAIPQGAATFVVPGTQIIDYTTTAQNAILLGGTGGTVTPQGTMTYKTSFDTPAIMAAAGFNPNPSALPGSPDYSLNRAYYLQNPDQTFLNINAQYTQQQANALGGGGNSAGITGQTNVRSPTVFDTSSAAGIAKMLSGIGSAPGGTLALLAGAEGYVAPAVMSNLGFALPAAILAAEPSLIDWGMSAIAPRDTSAAAVNSTPVILPASTTVFSSTGTLYGPGIGAMNADVRSGVKVAVDPVTGEVAEYTKDAWGNYGLIGGVSRYGAQSGEFSVDISGNKINLNTISPFYTENIPKSQAPGANIPWWIPSSSPALMSMDQTGITGAINTTSNLVQPSAVTTLDLTKGTYSISPPTSLNPLTILNGGFGARASGISGFTIGNTVIGSGKITPAVSSSSGTPDIIQTLSNDVQAWAGLGVSAFDTVNQMFGLGTPGQNLFPQNPVAKQYESTVSSLTSTGTQQQQTLTQENAALTTFTAGKISGNQWIGTPADYATYKGMLSQYNQDVATDNATATQLQNIQNAAIQSGLLLQQPGGNYTINPAASQPYGQFSAWSQGASQVMQNITGVSAAKFAAYEQTSDYTTQHWYSPVTNVLYGAFKQEVLNPGQVASYAVVGAGASLAAEAVLPIASGYIGTVAAGEGIAASTAQTFSAIGSSSIFQGALIAVPAALSIGSASDWGKNSTQQTEVNIGGMLPNLAGLIVGGGIAAYGPRAVTGISNEYTERMSTIQQADVHINYNIVSDVQNPSGVGGNLETSVSTRTLAPTTLNVLGYDITIPRIFTPDFVTKSSEAGGVNWGKLLSDRLGGTEAYPMSGSRAYSLELRYGPGDEVATGTGTLTYGEVRLPRTFDDYSVMAKTDYPLLYRNSGINLEELAQSYMSNAMATTPRTVGFRPLDVTVNIGTDIFDAFSYNFNEETGTTHVLNPINMVDYFRTFAVGSEGGLLPEYRANIIRDFAGSTSGDVDITITKQPTARSSDISGSMATYMNDYVKGQFIDVIDRAVLNNPDLEFERTLTTPEPSLSESTRVSPDVWAGPSLSESDNNHGGIVFDAGSGGRTSSGGGRTSSGEGGFDAGSGGRTSSGEGETSSGGGTMRSPAAALMQRSQVETDNVIAASFPSSETQASTLLSSPAESSVVFGLPASSGLILMAAPDIVTSTAQPSSILALQLPKQVSGMDYATIVSPVRASTIAQLTQQKPDQDYVAAFLVTPSTRFTSIPESSSGLDIVTAYESSLSLDIVTAYESSLSLDIVTAYEMASGTLQGQETNQITEPILGYSPISETMTAQTPALIQVPALVQTQYNPQVPPPSPPSPPPSSPLSPPPFIPFWLPGSLAVQPPGETRRKGHRKFLEYFPIGLDISTFGTSTEANPFTSIAGRMKYKPRETTPEIYRFPVERSNYPVMKPVKYKSAKKEKRLEFI